MSERDNGGPAFPVPDSGDKWLPQGMSLRDYFAAKAMAAYCHFDGSADSKDEIATDAYAQADAMLAERNK